MALAPAKATAAAKAKAAWDAYQAAQARMNETETERKVT